MSLKCLATKSARSGEAAAFPMCGFSLAALVAAALLALAVLVGAPAQAMATQGDALSLTVKAECGCEFSAQDQVSIWRVAQLGDDGSLVPLGGFANATSDWSVADDASVRALADSLEAFVTSSGIAATASASLSADGVVEFGQGEALEPGCYLVLGNRHQSGDVWHEFVPSLVMLPTTHDGGAVDYAPVVTMKYEEGSDDKPETPATPPNPNPGEKLPQTGQLWWPVAVLLVAGIVLLALGASRKSHK